MFEVLVVIRPQPGLLEAHYCVGVAKMLDEGDLTRFNKIAIQGIPQMAVD